MIMSELEAQVVPEKWQTLRDTYGRAITQLEPGIVATFLVQDTGDPAMWRIMTLWRDREALAAMRASGQTPTGIVIFRTAGAEPHLKLLEVAAHTSV